MGSMAHARRASGDSRSSAKEKRSTHAGVEACTFTMREKRRRERAFHFTLFERREENERRGGGSVGEMLG